jgi:CubicO group peptidase (beta-lactamase class C family)
MKLRVCAVALATLASTLISPFADAREQPQKPMSKPQADALRLIDVWLESEQNYRQIPALSAAIVQGDKTVFLTGYGTIDVDRKVPATGQTLYSICSISKLFTSVALMQQWEAGKVSLDAPVTTYLPWATLKPLGQDSVPVTLRTLLTHSSGLPRDFNSPYWVGPNFSFPGDEEVKATLPEQTPLWPASRWFQYSNLGLTLVGDTVQAVAATPYADYVKARVLDPLGMEDTSVGLPMSLYGKRLAVGWGSVDRKGQMDLLKPFNTRAVTPAAGYVSSAEDLSRFARWQFRLLRTNKAEVLKASTLREMQRVQFLDPDWSESWGLGFRVWRTADQTYVGHDGACPGYKTALTVRPASETAVVVMMTGMLDASARADAVFELLDKRKAAEAKQPDGVAEADLEAYAGLYSGQPWTDQIAIAPWAGGLAELALPSTSPAKGLSLLKPAGKDTFRRLREDGSDADLVRFVRDASGKVVRFQEFSSVHERVGDLPSADRTVPKSKSD